MNHAELRDRMNLDNKKQKYVVIKKDISEEDSVNLKKLTQEHSILHAFVFEETQKRWYVMPEMAAHIIGFVDHKGCLLYTSPSPRDQRGSRMPSSA